MSTRRPAWLWLVLALTPLGCPLLIEDDFVLVAATPAGAAGADDEPAAAPCPAMCDSCTDSVCLLECSGEAACKDRMLACPPGLACQVSCSGKRACEKLRLSCPREGSCSVRCEGAEDACKGMTVTCGTSQCEAECHGAIPGPQLICGQSAACVSCP